MSSDMMKVQSTSSIALLAPSQSAYEYLQFAILTFDSLFTKFLVDCQEYSTMVRCITIIYVQTQSRSFQMLLR